MKNAIRFLALISMIIAVFSMAGCKMAVMSAEKLLRPPKSGAEVEEAIEDYAGESVILKNPVNASSEFTSSLNLIDLDYDGTEEAVAFYTVASNETDVHINVLKHIGDEWVTIGDFSGYGSNIDSLSFRNLSKGMKQFDIVTTWSYIDSKVLTIHKVVGEGRRADLRLICDESYESMGYVDVDKDGYYELFLINGDFSDRTKVPTAKVVKIEKYDVLNIGMISLSREIVGFINSYCQEINDENITMISVYDYVNADGMYGTDVVYWDSRKASLNLLHVDGATNSAFSTLRSTPVLSCDVNADTFVEIPVQEPIVGSSVNEKMYTSALTYTKWCRLVPLGEGLKLDEAKNYRLYFTASDYLEIEKSLVSQITVSRNTKDDVWYIVTYNPEDLESTEVLAVVRSVTHENTDKYLTDGYKQLSSTADNKATVYKITDKGRSFGFGDSDFVNANIVN